ncbi:MAG: YihY/virulence factor BrkB family protein [Ilumatobacteraceae bacterium]
MGEQLGEVDDATRQDDATRRDDGIKARLDRFQTGRKPIAFLVGVIKKFVEDRGSRLAALVAYFGFFSLFPALLALVTILGFVLEGHEDLRNRIQESALAQFPVIGDSLGGALEHPLTGNTVALVIGLVGALWAGLGAMQAAQEGMNTIWGVSRADRPKFFAKRARSIGALVLIGTLFGVTAVVPQITGAFTSGPFGIVVLFVSSAVIDSAAFLVAFRVLTAARTTWRELLPGAVLAGVAYLVLQSLGTLYISRVLQGAQNTYGTFAVVIGLLSWMYLLAQVTMFAAEVNVVSARGLWPRSLFDKPRPEANGNG